MNRVQVICFFYNEETLARLFLQHYAWADEILAVVSKSSDRTREFLEAARNVRVLDFEFPAGMDDRIKTDTVNALGFLGVGPAVIRFTMEQHLKFSVVRNNFWVIKK